ncbi:Rhomboid family protein [Pyrolobus fumarii 1A]|uniref:Rhomboid family protein n=1 Tax=Pyrolobus fumarii (strain DSM 11204 / 1A) TaxID=694429 RepID=G0EHP1_PYRF1|nr:rhomboid family intramembrane serine protease [Pyrolobus fumarii]AEM39394.1 Rhomboid family protein [Pyrolobus fumarii 1A]
MAIPIEDTNVYLHRPLVNPLLIAVNVAIFIIGVLAPGLLGAHSYNEIVLKYGLVPFLLVNGVELHRLLTHMFLHGGLDHLLGNMLFLYIFGDNIEATMGPARYLAFYVIGGLVAVAFHVLSIAMMPPEALLNYRSFTGVDPWLVPAIGASGAISAVLGAYLLLYPRSLIRALVFWLIFPMPVVVPAGVFILFWFIYQLFMGMATLTGGLPTGVAFWAHIGGFIAGIALTPLFVDKKRVAAYRLLLQLRGFHDIF